MHHVHLLLTRCRSLLITLLLQRQMLCRLYVKPTVVQTCRGIPEEMTLITVQQATGLSQQLIVKTLMILPTEQPLMQLQEVTGQGLWPIMQETGIRKFAQTDLKQGITGQPGPQEQLISVRLPMLAYLWIFQVMQPEMALKIHRITIQ